MSNKVYYAHIVGFGEDCEIRVEEFNIEKETPRQYQVSRNGKGYMRLNKYFIGSKDSIGRYYALTPQEAVNNLKTDMIRKRDEVYKELKRLEKIIDYRVEL